MMTIIEEYELVLSKASIAGPASDEMIAAAEQQLAIRFPAPYRKFLKKYGAAVGVGFEIAGLYESSGDGPPMWQHVVKMSEQFKRFTKEYLPATLVPICDDGCEVAFYINADPLSENTACSILAYGPGIDGEVVASRFEEFVVKLANGAIEV